MKTILVIEDDADNREVFREILKGQRYFVSLAASMPTVRYVTMMRPDLILLDHWVGNGLGSHFCRQLKADPDTKHIPVVFISAHCDVERLAEQCGANSAIAKPFDVEHFISAVQQALSKH